MTRFNRLFKNALYAIVLTLSLQAFSSANAGLVTSFSDINLWAGSVTGSNQAALVIQWNDEESPTSLAWGYRWDGAATGFDMFTAIAGNIITVDAGDVEISTTSTGLDSRLTLTLKDYGWGIAVEDITFTDGSYQRSAGGWMGGYWSYSLFGGDFEYYDYDAGEDADYNQPGSEQFSTTNWLTAPFGFAERELSDGYWDGWSFDPTFSGAAAIVQPFDAQAVPEPSSALLLVVGGAAIWYRNRKKCRAQVSV